MECTTLHTTLHAGEWAELGRIGRREGEKNPYLITIIFEISKIFFMKRIQLDKVFKLLFKLFLAPWSKTLIFNTILGIYL